MNLLSALEDALEMPQQHRSDCPEGRITHSCAITTPGSLASTWILLVHKASFIQVALLIGKVFLKMPYRARSFHAQTKLSSRILRDIHRETHLWDFSWVASQRWQNYPWIQWRREMRWYCHLESHNKATDCCCYCIDIYFITNIKKLSVLKIKN